jgi:ribonuclease P protein component
MLPKRQRLTRSGFKEALIGGSIVHTPHFSARVNKVNKTEKPRYSCVVSKKVAPLATDRNLIRRRVMDAARGGAKSAIFYAKKDAGKISFQELKSEIGKIIN